MFYQQDLNIRVESVVVIININKLKHQQSTKCPVRYKKLSRSLFITHAWFAQLPRKTFKFSVALEMYRQYSASVHVF